MFRVLIAVALALILQGCIGAAYLSNANSRVEDNSLQNRSEVIFAKGKPYKETTANLVYKTERKRIKGVAIAFIIPLPLYLPIGKEEITYSLEGEKVTEVTRLHSKSRGGFCGFVPDLATHIELKFGCSSFNSEDL